MTLLKNDGTAPTKALNVNIIWPEERLSAGLGLSMSDGWLFGIGFGLALTVALPVILVLTALIIAVILAVFGSL